MRMINDYSITIIQPIDIGEKNILKMSGSLCRTYMYMNLGTLDFSHKNIYNVQEGEGYVMENRKKYAH